MGGGKSGGAPGQDPVAMMEAMAKYNRLNQYTPQGNVEFSGDDRNTATVTLSPEQQAIFEGQQAVTGGALERMLGMQGSNQPQGSEGIMAQTGNMNELSKYLGGLSGFDTSGLPALAGVDDFGLERSRVEQAQFDRMMGLLEPGQEKARSDLEQTLANRGVPVSARMAGTMGGRLEDSISNQNLSAAQEAVLMGGQEQSRLFGQTAQARGQMLNEMLSGLGLERQDRSLLMNELMTMFGADETGRAQGFNELAALLGMSQVGQPGQGMAGFWQPGQVDVTGANSVAQQGWQMNQDYSLGNQMMDLTGTLGGAFLSGGLGGLRGGGGGG